MSRVKLDATDIGLLSLLRGDAWLSIKELGASVNLSASAVHDRIKRLRNQGVLSGARADVNMESLGLGLDVLVLIELSRHDQDVVTALIDDLAAAAEVQAVFFLGGEIDLIVRIAARDAKSLRTHLEKLALRPDIARMRTSIVYEARFPNMVPAPAED